MSSLPGGLAVTFQGCLNGMRLALPLSPGIAVYALAFGAGASGRGLSFGESVAMSAFVFAGASQMLSLELWRESWTWLSLLTVAAVTATVNARFVLMGASLQPAMRGAPPLRSAAQLFLLVDASWIIDARYREEGGRDLGVFVGAGILLWAVWVSATMPGFLAGALVPDPRRWGLDLVMPIFFATMTIPLWRGLAVSAGPWAAAALVGAAVHWAVPGYFFIVAGALAGAVVGAFARDP